MSSELQNLRNKRHLKNLEDAIYKEGFEAANHFAPPYIANPYPFPEAASQQRMELSLKPILTSEDKVRLQKLNATIDATAWSKWSAENYERHCKAM
jgi:hypothetical protein